MKIFITGGTGFIGSYLVLKLAKRKHKLLLLVRGPYKKLAGRDKSIAFLETDLKDAPTLKKELRKFKPDAVIHLAWEGIGTLDYGPETSIKNLNYSLNLIKAAAESKCGIFVGVGSSWEYGDSLGRASEDNPPPKPHDLVAALVAAKRAIKAIGGKIAEKGGMQFIWAVPFFVFGPKQRSSSLIPYLISNFKKGAAPAISNKEGGNDFIYVQDVADALIAILENCKRSSAVYNVGTGRITSVAKIANLVAREFGQKPFIKEPKKPLGFYAGISKIRRDTGWKPKTSIKEGVKKTVNYYKNL